MTFTTDILELDPEPEIERITRFLKDYLRDFHRNGFVIGLSGGIDSALASTLCVRAVGPDRVYGIIMPERDSHPDSGKLAREHARNIGIEHETVDISHVLDAFGTYEKRDSILKRIYGGYTPDHRIRMSLPPDILNREALNFFTLDILEGDAKVFSGRLRKNDVIGIMATQDTKQRTRMMHLYYHAESRNYAVCGTTNRPEMVQGYFVKYGDGGVDVEPLAHLYKAQVYMLSKALGIHQGIIDRAPSPDTFNSHVTDEEFFFRMPYEKLDLLLYAWEHDVDRSEVASALGLDDQQIDRAFKDFESKYRATEHLRTLPPTLE